MKPVVDPDADLAQLDAAQLLEVARTMRQAIRRHRSCSGHDLCWYQPELWVLLPEASAGAIEVPESEEFLRRCAVYRASLNVETGRR